MARVNLAKTSPSSFRRRVFSVPPPAKKCRSAELPNRKPRSASEEDVSTNDSPLAKSGGTTLPNILSPQAPASSPNKSEAKKIFRRGLATAFETASQETTLGNDTPNLASIDVTAPPFTFPKRRLSMSLRKAENWLRESEESFELHDRYLTASAELEKGGLCWHSSDLKCRASRVQRKVRNWEATEIHLAAIAKDERAMLVDDRDAI